MTERKKLIEVALPLEAINRESSREKSIRRGHPSTLHLWWARRPLAACRAVLFASLVDDPSSDADLTEEEADAERQRLFALMERLVTWEAGGDEALLAAARHEITRSTRDRTPVVIDPFCGGGAIPLEAQRLGLRVVASDLNPVAVLVTKAVTELPSQWLGEVPVNPSARNGLLMQGRSKGLSGLATDIRYYGDWMRRQAYEQLCHQYPPFRLPDGRETTALAWLWTRTVRCPNPACGRTMPLLTSFVLASRPGRERYLHPIIEGGTLRFAVRPSPPSNTDATTGYKRGMSGIFQCAFCAGITTRDYVAAEGVHGRLGVMPTAVVVAAGRSRDYLPANDLEWQSLDTGQSIDGAGLQSPLAENPRDVWCRNFGLTTPAELFTPRQLRLLTTLSDLVSAASRQVLADGGSSEYAVAVATYLGLAVSKLADYNSSLVVWSPSRDQAKATFARQALPMVWDFTEVNPFAEGAGDLTVTIHGIAEAVERLPAGAPALVRQEDATSLVHDSSLPLTVCTDPPYFDNIGYADLSDFFYVWLRRSLKDAYPDLFSTLLTPKSQELVALSYRFEGNRALADKHFEDGLHEAFSRMLAVQDPDYPMTLFYAFKQAESDRDGYASTGWESMLEGLLGSGFMVTGTWPMRTERGSRSVAIGTSALASSIVLVCRPRPTDAPLATRKEFISALRDELPEATRRLQSGSIAPVDLAQAAIGPGMAIFSRFAKVIEADGKGMRVRTALSLINQILDETLAEQESDFDADTRWAIAWFEQVGSTAAAFGLAETLSKAKNTAMNGLVAAGIVESKSGKVRLVPRAELQSNWDPRLDSRLTIWEVSQHLIRALESEGEAGAAELLRKVGSLGDMACELAYRLYVICERKKWTKEAVAYNSLVVSWPEIARLAATAASPAQQELL